MKPFNLLFSAVTFPSLCHVIKVIALKLKHITDSSNFVPNLNSFQGWHAELGRIAILVLVLFWFASNLGVMALKMN